MMHDIKHVLKLWMQSLILSKIIMDCLDSPNLKQVWKYSKSNQFVINCGKSRKHPDPPKWKTLLPSSCLALDPHNKSLLN